MFTGIVKGMGEVLAIERLEGLMRLTIKLPKGTEESLERGASVAVNGVCLSAAAISGQEVCFDIMAETLNRTTLGNLVVGKYVNIERSAKDGAEIGGHAISGHIDCTAKIAKVETPDNNKVLTFEVPAEYMRYVFSKGYIALNGASLTITGVERDKNYFKVWLIPETLRLTTFGLLGVGDLVNLEVERGTMVTVDTIRNFLEERLGGILPNLRNQLEEQLLLANDSSPRAFPFSGLIIQKDEAS